MAGLKPGGELESFRLHLIDVSVIHLHEREKEALLVYTLRYEDDGEEFPGSVTVPLDRVKKLRLRAGSELILLAQKTSAGAKVKQHDD